MSRLLSSELKTVPLATAQTRCSLSQQPSATFAQPGAGLSCIGQFPTVLRSLDNMVRHVVMVHNVLASLATWSTSLYRDCRTVDECPVHALLALVRLPCRRVRTVHIERRIVTFAQPGTGLTQISRAEPHVASSSRSSCTLLNPPFHIRIQGGHPSLNVLEFESVLENALENKGFRKLSLNVLEEQNMSLKMSLKTIILVLVRQS